MDIANKQLFATSLLALGTIASQPLLADSIAEALAGGKAYGDFRLRYETVDQDNSLKDADALTLRSRLGYVTDTVNGFSATLEFEDISVVADMDDYSNAIGKNPDYSVIADPETTEIAQSFLQYKTAQTLSKLGRQVLTLDNHRFVGHVGWRQDRQTFDAFSTQYNPSEKLKLQYAYLDQRNRIFAEDRDVNSEDHLAQASYKMAVGTLIAYAYMLEVDDGTDNALDTFGLRFEGATPMGGMKLLYSAEYASQESENGSLDYDADYMLLEGGLVFSGLTAKVGYEVLGSDDGNYGFSTPLATLHKFNGWGDQFLSTPDEGLVDMSVSLSGKLMGGKWSLVYHDYEADEDSATVDDLGDEINAVYAMNFGKTYYAGIKYAAYSAGDIKVDADKFWLWGGAKF